MEGRVAVDQSDPDADARLPDTTSTLSPWTELPLSAPAARGTGGIETIDGYHVARWSDANLAYVAVSDMDENALGEFVEAFRRGGGSTTEPTRP